MMSTYDYQTADPLLYSLLKEYAYRMRINPTEAESILWQQLRGKALGQPFRRQHIIGPFIADFICVPRKLILEIDGGYHQLPDQQISDEERTQWLEAKGYKVIRFTNEEVIADIDSVINTIKTLL
ncbi:MAG: endonuclease domain-containing protein [Bacteroidaceae bacterium]|nr:endonuclease domain-containing protein [Bacteroidaceae bacterium]MBQ9175559.1 endonuclease domain-containing protein [Bacteroidaceae bacterium]MBR1378339.1 endonuclease domain-containing protein [Bacteroidaceae bacterium]